MTTKLENRFLTASDIVEWVAVNNEDDARLSGYAVVYYDGTERTEFVYRVRDSRGKIQKIIERIMPGSFDELFTSGNIRDVAALFNHDPNRVLGRVGAGTLTLTLDNRGLRFEALPAQTSSNIDVLTYVARGEVTGCSSGFIDAESNFREENRNGETVTIREIVKIGRLRDIGPVTFPAYKETNVDLRDELPIVQRDDNFYCKLVAWGIESRFRKVTEHFMKGKKDA